MLSKNLPADGGSWGSLAERQLKWTYFISFIPTGAQLDLVLFLGRGADLQSLASPSRIKVGPTRRSLGRRGFRIRVIGTQDAAMSALGPLADVALAAGDVCFGGNADVTTHPSRHNHPQPHSRQPSWANL